MSSETGRKAIDLSNHLSELSKRRKVSPLKGLAKYMNNPNVIPLAGGMPHPDYFPFADVSANALASDSFTLEPKRESSSLSWVWKLFGAGKEKTSPINVPKYASDPVNEVNLAVALQYGTAQGIVPLQKFIKEFVTRVYQPAYSDFATLVHTGNTDGWARAVLTLCNPGEMYITEEWSYPSAMFASQPYNVRPTPIAMDAEGMRADDLYKTLDEWNEEERGAKRPHVMYTVPVGQNPSGATMGEKRKKEIYAICVKFDIIIVEDDPYYFLQEGPYKPKSERSTVSVKHDQSEFLSSLAPSYLKFDYQGRVIRMDTFSKYIAPGSRLGYFTCSPQMAERLERQGETSTQAPCGFGQSLITQLLTTWKYDGYVRWLHGLAVEYKARRDYFIDTLFEEFHVRQSYSTESIWAGCEVYDCYAKPTDTVEKTSYRKLFTFIPPTSGMFVWLSMDFESHPSFKEGEEETLEMQLFINLAEAGVLVAPGWYFAADEDMNDRGRGHFRISFSNAEFPTMKNAIKILGEVVKDFFKEH
ncbi:uncharacterized protein PHACADRAFT_250454 [Phanerochaete carnosa HHB-10118-sp]|uniref:Aminotransferase class I/classII large domain-containing protein n=1 Tax=Phanerochaete carnosa (strain HHB-10118-sp) TaxID=650164 RepID=K5W731_PHACS|nr:uncharacterized protein PHACADRAFT_250454 [Phanerochaete carnosa HHB-10118-sp]EKM59753.1 hypothetical protein PHACADRAFT_250454 [Phanerochaete carnosa HHB-10118-sp]